jgi:UDP-N-acetylmuramate: L-alanyl-gamma-D-glutamyl-meso-diaminopimelate ligase
MGAFAAYLKRAGVEVTGSDQNVYPPMSDVLRNAGVTLFSGYSAENLRGLPAKPDLVVIGNVIGATNPEAREAIDHGYAYTSLPEAMERLFLDGTRNLVVAGTHGKTTTSSMLAHLLNSAGKEPSYFIGGVSHDLPFSFNIASTKPGSYFVLEGDEYDTAFWDKVPKFSHYLPNDVILTSVEFDHADIYADLAAVKRAFSGLIGRIRAGGRLIACYDYENVRELVKASPVGHLSYGSESARAHGARFTPGNVRVEGEWTRFDVRDGDRVVDSISMRAPGHHNVLNALAVWIEARELGISSEAIRRAFETFRGVKRRQEVRGEVDGVLVIDDFAHHPTAVRETLRALKLRYPGRRLVSVYEPRSATSRRKVFQKEFAQAFLEADCVFISVPYDQSKIPAQEQFSSDQLVDDIRGLGGEAKLMPKVDEGTIEVARYVKRGDLVAVLSNGGFEGFIPKFLKQLETARGAGGAQAASTA